MDKPLMFALPKDVDATIRFLDHDSKIIAVRKFGDGQVEDELNKPRRVVQFLDTELPDVHHWIDTEHLAPHLRVSPYSNLHKISADNILSVSRSEMSAEEIEGSLRRALPPNLPPPKLRFMLNAISTTKTEVPVPKRKKKSWMRLSSQKKWARSFPKRFIFTRKPIVLSVSPQLKQKLADLAAQKLGN